MINLELGLNIIQNYLFPTENDTDTFDSYKTYTLKYHKMTTLVWYCLKGKAIILNTWNAKGLLPCICVTVSYVCSVL